MRTLLFCTAWADSQEHMEWRVGRWLDHHAMISWPCEVELAVIGDGIDAAIGWPRGRGRYRGVNLHPHLGRPSHLDYPGWWRSFGQSGALARRLGCQRIWHVESDFFLASRRMVNRMNEIERGWAAFWCSRYNFPETAIQVIGEEHFDRLAEFERDCHLFQGQHAEHIIPIVTIIRDVVGDRYGERGVSPELIKGLDFYGQRPGDITPIFREEP